MIVPRACDLCLRPLPTELVQFELVRGSLAASPNLQWAIEPIRGGIRLTTICRQCSEYLQAGIAHLRTHSGTTTQADAPPQSRAS